MDCPVTLPDNFYHHSPELHLAFVCISEDRCDLVTVDAPDIWTAWHMAAEDMKEHGWGDKQPIHFLGFAV